MARSWLWCECIAAPPRGGEAVAHPSEGHRTVDGGRRALSGRRRNVEFPRQRRYEGRGGNAVDGEFRVLDGVEARVGGRRLELGHARQRCVLVALLVDVNRAVTADRLLERVWDERPPLRARSVLRTYVSRLRQAPAPPGATITRQDGGSSPRVSPAPGAT